MYMTKYLKTYSYTFMLLSFQLAKRNAQRNGMSWLHMVEYGNDAVVGWVVADYLIEGMNV